MNGQKADAVAVVDFEGDLPGRREAIAKRIGIHALGKGVGFLIVYYSFRWLGVAKP